MHQSQKEGKDKESIQSSTTPGPRGDKNTQKNHTQESQGVSSFPACDHKAAKNRQDSIIKTNMKHE